MIENPVNLNFSVGGRDEIGTGLVAYCSECQTMKSIFNQRDVGYTCMQEQAEFVFIRIIKILLFLQSKFEKLNGTILSACL
jgi:hypothetical protein